MRRHRYSRLRRVAQLVVLAVGVTNVSAQSLQATPAFKSSTAQSLSPVLSPAYAGMGIEPTNLFSFTGTDTVNLMTYNLLMNLANYTGVPPHLRIGGNSGDNILYSSETQYAGFQIYDNPSPSGSGSPATDAYIIGSGYFAALEMLPTGTPITYGLNMAYSGSDYLTQIVNQANAPLQLLKNVSVVGFEVGNEPDLYVQTGYRNKGWSVDDFGTEWANRVVSIYQNVLQPKGMTSAFFEPPATATTATNNGKPYRISNLVKTGVATDNGIYVAGWNQHDYYYYVNVSTYKLTLNHLMDLSNTVQQFTEWAGQAEQAEVTGKPYYLREMGAVGPTGLQGITDVFGNTLWTFNFFLYAATLQISSVQMHMTANSWSSPWIPVPFADQQVRVRSSYYAWAAVDQIIGQKCTTRVASMPLSNVPSAYENHVVGYTAYDNDNLRAIIMINTQITSSSQDASSMDFELTVPDLAGQTLFLSTLTADSTDATTGTTWNGISYEQKPNGAPSTVDSSSHTVKVGSDGTVTIPVRDSQAVVAVPGFQLGSEKDVDTSACASLTGLPEGGENVASGTASGQTSTAAVFGGASDSAPTFKATGGFAPGAANNVVIPTATALLFPCLAFALSRLFALA